MLSNIIYLIITNVAKFQIQLFKMIYDITMILSTDVRTNVYIGITSLMIAVVIFIAELISDKNRDEIEKQILLQKTNILKNILLMILILFFTWIANIFKNEVVILYFYSQIIINIMIIVSILKIYKMFKTSINLLINRDEYMNEKEKFIETKLKKYEQMINDDINQVNINRQQIQTNLTNMNNVEYRDPLYISNMELRARGYKPITAKNSGKVEEILYDNLYILDQKFENANSDKDKSLYIIITEGENVKINSTIAYISKENEKFKEEVSNCYKISVNNKNAKEELKYIKKQLQNYFQNEQIEDLKNEINHIYEIIIKNNLTNAQDVFNELIREWFFDAKEKSNYQNIFISICEEIEGLSIVYDKFYLFRNIRGFLSYIYRQIIKSNSNRIELFLNEYISNIKNVTFLAIPNNNTKYYEYILAEILILIKELIKNKKISEINIIFERYHFQKETENDHKLNFEFIIGFMMAILYEQEKLDQEQLQELINIFKDEYENICIFENNMYNKDIKTIIETFKDTKSSDTIIQNTISIWERNEEKHRYSFVWTPEYIEYDNILIAMLFTLDDIWSYENLMENEIKTIDIHFYNNVKLFMQNNNEYKRIIDLQEEKIVKEKYDIIIQYLDDVIKICEDKLTKQIIEKELSKKQEEKLIQNTIEQIDKSKNEFIKILKEKGKIINLEDKIQTNQSISEFMISRETFFKENDSWIDYIAKDLANRHINMVFNIICNQIKKEAELVQISNTDDLNNILNKMDDLSDVIIMCNNTFKRNVLKTINNYFIYGEYKIPIIKRFDNSAIILSLKSIKAVMKYELRINIKDCSKESEFENDKNMQTKCLIQVNNPMHINFAENIHIYRT